MKSLIIFRIECLLEDFEASNCKNAQDLLLASQKALEGINLASVAEYYGLQHDSTDKSEKEKVIKNEFQDKRDLISLCYTGLATAYRHNLLNSLGPCEDAQKLFDEALENIFKWTPNALTDGRYLLLWVWKMQKKDCIATALEHLIKYLSEPKNSCKSQWKKAHAIRNELVEKLGWDIWKEYFAHKDILNFPKDYAKF